MECSLYCQLSIDPLGDVRGAMVGWSWWGTGQWTLSAVHNCSTKYWLYQEDVILFFVYIKSMLGMFLYFSFTQKLTKWVLKIQKIDYCCFLLLFSLKRKVCFLGHNQWPTLPFLDAVSKGFAYRYQGSKNTYFLGIKYPCSFGTRSSCYLRK